MSFRHVHYHKLLMFPKGAPASLPRSRGPRLASVHDLLDEQQHPPNSSTGTCNWTSGTQQACGASRKRYLTGMHGHLQQCSNGLPLMSFMHVGERAERSSSEGRLRQRPWEAPPQSADAFPRSHNAVVSVPRGDRAPSGCHSEHARWPGARLSWRLIFSKIPSNPPSPWLPPAALIGPAG